MIRVTNETFYSARFRAYTESIFNAGGLDEVLQEKREFKELAEMIDPWIEKISMPYYMT